MTRADRDGEIRDYVRYLNRVALLAEKGGATTERTLLGFSQGAHTAARWAVLGRVAIGRLILWGAGCPRDLPQNAGSRLSRMSVVLVRGAEDGLRQADEERLDEEWLTRNGVTYSIHDHDHGHRIVRQVLEELAI